MVERPDASGFEVFTSGPSGLRVVIAPSVDAAVDAALIPLSALALSPRATVVGLATGATFGPVFDEIVARDRRGVLQLSRLSFTHLDEFLGLAATDPASMAAELDARLFSRLVRKPQAFVPVPATAGDPIAAHAAALRVLGPVDLQYLGLGRNGHVAFNEPGTPFESRTQVATLAPSTLDANRARFRDRPAVERAVTTGLATLLDARELVLVATGGGKAEAVQALLEGPVSTACPATLLRLHPRATVILDGAAASRLTARARATPERLPFAWLRSEELQPGGPVAVISPHPDDASISCGGLLASLSEKTHTVIVTMTTGARAVVPGAKDAADAARIREEEVRAEARILGAEAVFPRAAYYDRGAFDEADAVRLAEWLAILSPAWIVAPSRQDPHPTHRLTRCVLDEAVRRLVRTTGRPVEVWTFEGPWYQHAAHELNTVLVHDRETEARKLAAVRCHHSQLARVPFDLGAAALTTLRAVGFSESYLGGKEPGGLKELPPLETYLRERVAPS